MHDFGRHKHAILLNRHVCMCRIYVQIKDSLKDYIKWLYARNIHHVQNFYHVYHQSCNFLLNPYFLCVSKKSLWKVLSHKAKDWQQIPWLSHFPFIYSTSMNCLPWLIRQLVLDKCFFLWRQTVYHFLYSFLAVMSKHVKCADLLQVAGRRQI